MCCESFARRIVGVSWDCDKGGEVRHVKDIVVALFHSWCGVDNSTLEENSKKGGCRSK